MCDWTLRVSLVVVIVIRNCVEVLSLENGASDNFFMSPDELTWDEAEEASTVYMYNYLCL